MKKPLPPTRHQDYLDILQVTLKAETYCILDQAKVDDIMFRVRKNLGLIEDLSKKKPTGVNKKIKKHSNTFWFLGLTAFTLLTMKIVVENYIYTSHH